MNVPGLKYIAGFVAEPDEAALLAAVDAEPWLSDLKRRVQHYGYRYDYKARKVDPSMFLGPLPAWARPLAARLVAGGHMATVPDQLIVNEYEPGQGITAHVDCIPCFGPVVCSVTLGSQCVMELSAAKGDEAESILLERRSLVVLAGESRFRWRHAIPSRKSDEIGGRVLPRSRRVSLTFRTVIVQGR
ncbi:MAG: alpha-ketoglutarate-dependent dioxygenase AlkB [Planctomycetes bacterium]|nr:alpha-ketoglutarate-dependent dioxygenase AlkB [Planctomycetota bacterium]